MDAVLLLSVNSAEDRLVFRVAGASCFSYGTCFEEEAVIDLNQIGEIEFLQLSASFLSFQVLATYLSSVQAVSIWLATSVLLCTG